MLNLEEIKNKVKEKHKRAVAKKASIEDIANAFKVYVNYSDVLTWQEKKQLQKVYLYCVEAGLEFKKVLDFYGSHFDVITENLRKELSYLKGEDFSKPNVLILSQTRTLKYIYNMFTRTLDDMGAKIKNIRKVLKGNVWYLYVNAIVNGREVIWSNNDIRRLPLPVRKEIKDRIERGEVQIIRG